MGPWCSWKHAALARRRAGVQIPPGPPNSKTFYLTKTVIRFMEEQKIVFISNEILIDDIPAYAGGLGILSGGFLYTARDIDYPMVGITLLHKKGYVKHRLEDGEIISEEDPYNPENYFTKIEKKFFIDLKHLRIFFQVWEYRLSENVTVFFIDTDVEENPEFLRHLTDRLYIENSEEEKILKRLLLGLGSVKLVESLDINYKKFHLNESHCGFAAIELYKKWNSFEEVKKRIVFTTHTPLPHGHEKFSYKLVEKYYEIPKEIKMLSPNILNLSKILFYLSSYRNAVSWKHWLLVKRDYPSIQFDYITNGVHTKWVENEMKEIYDQYLPNWFKNPEVFSFAGILPLEKISEARKKIRKRLIEVINKEGYFNKPLDTETFSISIRRRITGYKRNDILFYDIERIEEIGKKYGLQILIGGVAHPKDNEGIKIVKRLSDLLSTLQYVKLGLLFRNGKFYERLFVSSPDLFLHSPIPPMEACGTSWMRASLNAVPILSSRDGGVVEAIVDGYNGWLFGENTLEYKKGNGEDEIYDKLEKIIQLWKKDEKEFLRIGINGLKTVGSLYNTKRMLKEYISRAYEK